MRTLVYPDNGLIDPRPVRKLTWVRSSLPNDHLGDELWGIGSDKWRFHLMEPPVDGGDGTDATLLFVPFDPLYDWTPYGQVDSLTRPDGRVIVVLVGTYRKSLDTIENYERKMREIFGEMGAVADSFRFVSEPRRTPKNDGQISWPVLLDVLDNYPIREPVAPQESYGRFRNERINDKEHILAKAIDLPSDQYRSLYTVEIERGQFSEGEKIWIHEDRPGKPYEATIEKIISPQIDRDGRYFSVPKVETGETAYLQVITSMPDVKPSLFVAVGVRKRNSAVVHFRAPIDLKAQGAKGNRPALAGYEIRAPKTGIVQGVSIHSESSKPNGITMKLSWTWATPVHEGVWVLTDHSKKRQYFGERIE